MLKAREEVETIELAIEIDVGGTNLVGGRAAFELGDDVTQGIQEVVAGFVVDVDEGTALIVEFAAVGRDLVVEFGEVVKDIELTAGDGAIDTIEADFDVSDLGFADGQAGGAKFVTPRILAGGAADRKS